jgi:ATP-dependent Clp protease protease subunit
MVVSAKNEDDAIDDTNQSANEFNSDICAKLIENRIVFLPEEITTSNATLIISSLYLLEQESSTDEITIYINSGGGDVNGCMGIYDTMQVINAPIKTICIGIAYSAAAVILSAGTKGLRFAYPNSDLMIHAIQVSGLSGSQSELSKESKRFKQENQCIMEVIARHTGQSLRKIKRDCKVDKYFNAEQSVKYGLIDQIVPFRKEIPPLIK